MVGSHFFFFAAIICVAINIVLGMIIVSRLQQRNVSINWILIRLYLPKYVHQYKKMILEETGRVDGLFKGWIVTINAAWVLALVGLLVKYA